MKIRMVTTILIFTGLIFSSCKNQDSEKSSTKTNNMVAEETESDVEKLKLLDKIENYILTEYLTERDLRTMSTEERKFQLYEIDLNNDGKKEFFINFVTPYFCGSGGCSVLLLSDQMEAITEFTVTRTPIYVEESMENGWRILMVQSEGKWRKLIYEDGEYPSNPSVVEINNSGPTEGANILFDNDQNNLKTFTF